MKDLNALSPKLQSFFFNNNVRNNVTANSDELIQHHDAKRYSNHHLDNNAQYTKDNHLSFSSPPTQRQQQQQQLELLEEEESEGSNNVTILHSIFSPKFHAHSAKKKLRSTKRHQQHHQHHGSEGKQQQHNNGNSGGKHHSIFSPVSTTSTRDASSAVSGSSCGVSEMSDDYSTIHAILRGDMLENIKRHVGLDEKHHPLSNNGGTGMMDGRTNVKKGMSSVMTESKGKHVSLHDEVNQHHHEPHPLLDAIKSMQQHQEVSNPRSAAVPSNDNEDDGTNATIVDDSTEVMLDKARLLASNGKRGKDQGASTTRHDEHDVCHEHVHFHDQDIFTSPPSGNIRQHGRAKKQTPKVTPPPPSTTTSEEEFYTPTASSAKPAASAATRSPMALNFDMGRMILSSGGKKGLPPVWEEDETTKPNHGIGFNRNGENGWDHHHPRQQNEDDQQSMDNSPMNMGDFRTPKQQHGMDWNVDDDEYEEEEEEEFFSPLVQHSMYTPSSSKNHNAAVDINAALDFNADSIFVNSHGQLSVQTEDVPSSDIPIATAAPAKRVQSKEANKKGLTPPMSDALASPLPWQQQVAATTAPAPPPPSSFFNPTYVSTPSPLTPIMSLSYPRAPSPIPQSPATQSTTFHLHSPSVSSLPPDALTVDFVKHCDDIDTLKAILSLLSSEDDNAQRNSGKRGKQLKNRYPSLVRLVEKRLHKLELQNEELLVNEEYKQDEYKQEEAQQGDHQQQQSRMVANGKSIVQLEPRIKATESSGPTPNHSSTMMAGVDKENVDPQEYQMNERPSAELIARETTTRPMESITVSFADSIIEECDGATEKNEGMNAANKHSAAANGSSLSISPPSIMESSLDMNLSESLFTLDDEDESFYWKHDEEKKEERHCLMIAEKKHAAVNTMNQHNHQHWPSHTTAMEETNHDIHKRYAELEEKLASTLTSNARLSGEVDSLIQEQNDIKAELSSKLQHMERLSQQQLVIATQQDNHNHEQISELDKINHALQEEIQRLHHQLQLVNQKATGTAHQLQLELEEARVQYAYLSRDKETLGLELDNIRERYNVAEREVARLKLLLRDSNKKNAATPESKDKEQQLRMVVDSAQLANQALANALAVSEKDLAEAYEAKEKSARECHALRDRTVKLEDKTSFLSSKVKEMNKELKSSHAYIDELYADLQTATTNTNQGSPSSFKEGTKNAAEIERRELEWMELERGYSQRIQELEGQLVRVGSEVEKSKQHQEHNKKVSMDAYMSVVKQTRHYKFEFMKNLQTIDDLKGQLDAAMLKSKSTVMINGGGGGGGKSLRVLQLQKSIEKSKQMVHGNDENAAPPPSNPIPPPPPPPNPIQGLTSVKQYQQRQGKQLNRVAAVRAAGGRKGLSEQLKRARRFGEKSA